MNKLLTCIAFCLFAPAAVFAHHSGIGFDRTKTVEVSGEITRFVWRNPHLAIVIDVTNDGETEEWKLEGPGTTVLSRQGLSKSALNKGDTISVVVHPMKSGKPGGLLQAITLADGTTHGMSAEYANRGSAPTQRSARQRPSMVDYVPPPEGETWQERERKTRPAQLPMVGNLPKQTVPARSTPTTLPSRGQKRRSM